MKHVRNIKLETERRSIMKHIYVLLILSGCATGVVNDEDSGTDSGCPPFVNTEIEFENCGECGHVCNPTTSDSCVDGECICSGMGYECMDGYQECKLGFCAIPDFDSLEEDPEATTCEFDHQCHGARLCVLGVCSEVPCLDNDGMPRILPCYDGPNGTQMNDPCQEGYRVCFGGRWGECEEQVLPILEDGILNCDGIDNDCDGCADGNWVGKICVPTDIRDFDILFIFDVSGSMAGTCNSVVEAMRRLGSSFVGNEHFHFGIDLIPALGTSCEPGIYHDFSTYEDFQLSLDTLECGSGGSEPNWDAPYMAAENIPMYNIAETLLSGEAVYTPQSWREDATHVIIEFTDEEGQGYEILDDGGCMVGGPVNESVMCSVMDTEVLAVVTKEKYVSDFDMCSERYILVNDAERMVSDLEDILESACADY